MKVPLSFVFACAVAFGQAAPTPAPASTQPPAPGTQPATQSKLDKEATLPPLDEATFLKTAAEKLEIQARYRLKLEQEITPIQAKYEALASKELDAIAAEESSAAAETCKARGIDMPECRIDPNWKDALGKQIGRVWREAQAAKAAPAATPPATPAK
jgi:hypothetical protein